MLVAKFAMQTQNQFRPKTHSIGRMRMHAPQSWSDFKVILGRRCRGESLARGELKGNTAYL